MKELNAFHKINFYKHGKGIMNKQTTLWIVGATEQINWNVVKQFRINWIQFCLKPY